MWDLGLIIDQLWVSANQIWSAEILNITEQGAFFYTKITTGMGSLKLIIER